MRTHRPDEDLGVRDGYRFGRRTYDPFPNGYSATIVWRQVDTRELYFAFAVGFVEIAVHYDGNIVYDTPITDDVLSVHCQMTETILRMIERLPPRQIIFIAMDGDGPKVLVECDASIVESGSDIAALAIAALRNKDADVRQILDALEESGFERDGDLEITGEWLEKEFPVKRGVDPRYGIAGGLYPVTYYTPIGHRFCEFIDGNCWRESLLIRTRSDARSVWRMLSHLHDDLHEDEV